MPKSQLKVAPWHRGVVVITTAKLHSTKSELRFCSDWNPAGGVLEICDSDNVCNGSGWKYGVNAFRRSTIPQKQFIVHHHFIVYPWRFTPFATNLVEVLGNYFEGCNFVVVKLATASCFHYIQPIMEIKRVNTTNNPMHNEDLNKSSELISR